MITFLFIKTLVSIICQVFHLNKRVSSKVKLIVKSWIYRKKYFSMAYRRSMLSLLSWETFLVWLESHSTLGDHWLSLVSSSGRAGHSHGVLFVSRFSSEVEVLGASWSGFLFSSGHAGKGDNLIRFMINTEFGVKFVFHLVDQSFVIVGDLLRWDNALFASDLFFHFGFNSRYKTVIFGEIYTKLCYKTKLHEQSLYFWSWKLKSFKIV